MPAKHLLVVEPDEPTKLAVRHPEGHPLLDRPNGPQAEQDTQRLLTDPAVELRVVLGHARWSSGVSRVAATDKCISDRGPA